jgi:DNA polymerase I-like protein with 3'-5' exonuclease and polymerase domains
MDAASALIKDKMESVWDLNVPLKVNIEVGDNWAAAH